MGWEGESGYLWGGGGVLAIYRFVGGSLSKTDYILGLSKFSVFFVGIVRIGVRTLC